MLVKPQCHGIARMSLDQLRGLARAELFFSLAGELGIADLHGQHIADLVPDVFRRQLHAARQEVAELAEFTHGLDDTAAQSIDVRTAGGRRNQVDIAFRH